MTISTAPKHPGTANRNERRRLRTRQAILEAADQIFHVKGIDEATIGELTEAADVARASFYNHFNTVDDIVSALAESAIRRSVERTTAILKQVGQAELLPCIGACVAFRTLARDPAIRFLIARPNILAAKQREIAVPLMRKLERQPVADGRLKPAGGHEAWLQIHPWITIAVLAEAERSGDYAAQEIVYAKVSLRLLGVDDSLAPELIELSKALVSEAGL